MPITTKPAEELLQRARALRRHARSIEQLDATVLYRRAGNDTWIGPTPAHCFDDLVNARNLLFHACDALRVGAARLEQRAARLEQKSIQVIATERVV